MSQDEEKEEGKQKDCIIPPISNRNGLNLYLFSNKCPTLSGVWTKMWRTFSAVSVYSFYFVFKRHSDGSSRKLAFKDTGKLRRGLDRPMRDIFSHSPVLLMDSVCYTGRSLMKFHSVLDFFHDTWRKYYLVDDCHIYSFSIRSLSYLNLVLGKLRPENSPPQKNPLWKNPSENYLPRKILHGKIPPLEEIPPWKFPPRKILP